MTKQYAFYFDSSSCTGCKACQVACKDKNNLEVGVLWRRVYSVTGGDWVSTGNAWTSQAFAYELSISCNHCQDPLCVHVCPTTAMHKREDGIVLVDASKCIGCKYCEWVCPYGAPQYDPSKGKMTKCNLCEDYLAEGGNPACVDACVMRALDFGELSELQAKYGTVDNIFPLPLGSTTQPALVITPHKDARRTQYESAKITNMEEI
jgi:anaerobic dimethyl sulfoxide reductase subunit B (iron-sulfur subunit)